MIFGLVVWWLWGGIRYSGVLRKLHVTERRRSGGQPISCSRSSSTFAVRRVQQKLLLIGIVMALVIRAGFIAVGAAAISTIQLGVLHLRIFLVLYHRRQARPQAGPRRRSRRNATTGSSLPGAAIRDHDRRLRRRQVPDHRRRQAGRDTDVVGAHRNRFLDLLMLASHRRSTATEGLHRVHRDAFALIDLRQLYFLIGGLLDRLVYTCPIDCRADQRSSA